MHLRKHYCPFILCFQIAGTRSSSPAVQQVTRRFLILGEDSPTVCTFWQNQLSFKQVLLDCIGLNPMRNLFYSVSHFIKSNLMQTLAFLGKIHFKNLIQGSLQVSHQGNGHRSWHGVENKQTVKMTVICSELGLCGASAIHVSDPIHVLEPIRVEEWVC